MHKKYASLLLNHADGCIAALYDAAIIQQSNGFSQSLSKAAVFGGAAFGQFSAELLFGGGVSAWGSVFRRSPCNDQRNEQGEWLKAVSYTHLTLPTICSV